MTDLKRCSICSETKPVEQFRRNQLRCNECANAAQKAFRAKHREEQRLYDRERWRQMTATPEDRAKINQRRRVNYHRRRGSHVPEYQQGGTTTIRMLLDGTWWEISPEDAADDVIEATVRLRHLLTGSTVVSKEQP